ncbi:MAG: MATE family efflux transporter [Bacteroidales bacterium]|nr:MATE family efflux transporter [Bacteroidales bacterium]
MNKEILRLALPNIITNITVPLLGMVDLAIVGHIGDETYIGAIALGTAIFNLIYWNFGFLRMGTSGLAAQAYGAGDNSEAMKILVRGITIAICAAVLLIALQWPIAKLSEAILNCSSETLKLTLTYFYIRIWAAPATLGLYAIKGWFIGMQNSKSPMVVAITLNIVNIVTSIVFVVWLKMDIAGVALGTVIAQYSGLLLAIALWFKHYGNMRHLIDIRGSLHKAEMKRFFKINSDIFLRTLCLCAVFTFIPAISANMGDRILAANTLIMQLFTLFSYIVDGYAYAGESLVGKYIGAKNPASLKKSIRYLLYWGIAFTAIFTLIYLFWSRDIYGILTNDTNVIDEAMSFNRWTLLIPICGFSAFIFDGIYIGATAAKSMRNIMFIATAVFFGGFFILQPAIGNDGLWIAFLLFLIFRGGLMWIRYKKVIVKPVENETNQ